MMVAPYEDSNATARRVCRPSRVREPQTSTECTDPNYVIRDMSELGERDTTVLQVIEEEDLKGFSFDGLKRITGLHSETLSRILSRLEDQGFLEKTDEGYNVSSRAEGFVKLHQLGTTDSNVPLLRTLLPSDLSIQEIISDVRGRWFGNLRWLGHSIDEEAITLKWVTEDGGIKVHAIFSYGELNIEAKLPEGRDLSYAVKAAHQLIGSIAKSYSRKEHRITRVAYSNVSQPYLIPA